MADILKASVECSKTYCIGVTTSLYFVHFCLVTNEDFVVPELQPCPVFSAKQDPACQNIICKGILELAGKTSGNL